MKARSILLVTALLSTLAMGCSHHMKCLAPPSKTIVVYDNQVIPPNIGISTGTYTGVDDYRYVNITVEFEQKEANEEPVSLGVVFAHNSQGKFGSRRYFTFEENFASPANPQMITLTGAGSWHGHPHDKSVYTARLPVMGPYVQVFPFNLHNQPRRFTVVLYLTH